MESRLQVGDQINSYQIIKVLGKSDVSTVYLAKDEIQMKKWILKEIPSPVKGTEALASFKEKFTRICQQLSKIEHKAITRIIDYFIEGDTFYIIREFLEGRSLAQFMEQHTEEPLTESQVKSWAGQIFDIVEFLHNQNPPVYMGVIVPKNLVLSPMGKIRIMDTGLSRFFPEEKQKDILIKVSPGYTAPEILSRNVPPGVQGDIYSLGVMFHYFLTHSDPDKNPFGFRKISEFRKDIDEKTETAIMRALSKNPEDRFKTIKEFKENLLGDDMNFKRTRVEASIKEIKIEQAPRGTVLQGNFHIRNSGKGLMEGLVYSEFTWLKLSPDRFRGNDENIRYWIDTSMMEPESYQENTVYIQTSDEKFQIPVQIKIAPSFLRNIGAGIGSLLFFLTPVFLFLLLGSFHIFIQQHAYQLILKEYNLIEKGIDFLITQKRFFIQKMVFPPDIIFMCKAFALLTLCMAFFIPYFIGKMREEMVPLARKKITVPAGISMLLPSLLLVVLSLLTPFPPALYDNAIFKYIQISNFIIPFVVMNIFNTLFMLLPRDSEGKTLTDNIPILKTAQYMGYSAYFIYVIIFVFLP